MNNLKVLLKNNFNLLLGRLQGKKERKKTVVAVLLLVAGMVGIFALYTLQALSMFKGLGALGLYDLCMFHAIITSLSVIIIIGVVRMSGKATTNDSDLLLSLPIKRRDIIISKTVNLYLFDLFFSTLLVLPYVILYQVFCKFSAVITVCGVATMLLLPMLSVGITYILDFVVTRLFNRMKGSSFIKSLFSVFIYVLIMALMIVKTATYGTVTFDSMEAYFSNRFFSNMFLKFIINQKAWATAGVLALTVIPFVVGMILYSINFGKSFSKFESKSKNLKFNNSRSMFVNLFKKEISSYVTTPAWIVNSIIGPIAIVVVSILFATMGKAQALGYLGLSAKDELFVGIVVLIFCAMIAMTSISCCSISLEGKNMWVLKSSPINEKSMFFAKSLTHFVIIEPFVIIGSIVTAISLQLSGIEFLAIFMLPTLINLILSLGGIFINILFPKFDFDNETSVVKNSLATLLTILFGVALTALLAGVYYLFNFLSFGYIVLICCGVYAVIFAVVLTLLMTVGVKKFRAL